MELLFVAIWKHGKMNGLKNYEVIEGHQWRCGRVVDCTGLENRQRETFREFESHRLRQYGYSPYLSTFLFKALQ